MTNALMEKISIRVSILKGISWIWEWRQEPLTEAISYTFLVIYVKEKNYTKIQQYGTNEAGQLCNLGNTASYAGNLKRVKPAIYVNAEPCNPASNTVFRYF